MGTTDSDFTQGETEACGREASITWAPSSWLFRLQHCASSFSQQTLTPHHWFKDSRAGRSGWTSDERTHGARAPYGWRLAPRKTNLSQNRQGVCCLSWGSSASSSSSQAASSPLSDSSGRSSSSSTAPRPPSTRQLSALPGTDTSARHQPPPRSPAALARASPTLPARPHRPAPHPGGEGLSPAPRPACRANTVLRGRRYPPAEPDANEHMAVLPRSLARLGAGTGPGSARAAAAEQAGPGTLGTSASARQGRNSGSLSVA